MSIKDFFIKTIVTQDSINDLTSSVESFDLVKEKIEQNQTFTPNLDFCLLSSIKG